MTSKPISLNVKLLKILERVGKILFYAAFLAWYSFFSFFTGLGAEVYYYSEELDRLGYWERQDFIDEHLFTWSVYAWVFWLILVLIWNWIFDYNPKPRKLPTKEKPWKRIMKCKS